MGRALSQPATTHLADLSIEELGAIHVTSVSRRSERLEDAAASVFVISADDIRRSGARTLPEALRLAPNVQVSRESASSYVISARGFNAPNSNKLLVLIDGRSVYTPLFSGVFWDVQDVVMEDVERIEVISGPGGTLWGTNAVNGVINVITRSAADTRGGMATVTAGNRDSEAALRWGGTSAGGSHFRLYAKHADHDHTVLPTGQAREDAWRRSLLGARADWDGGADRFSAQANAYSGAIGQPEPGTFSTGTPLALAPVSVSGVQLQASWVRTLGDGSRFNVSGYYDRTKRTVPPTFGETLDIVDLQAQYESAPTAGHTWVAGGEYRRGNDRVSNSAVLAFLPARERLEWTSLYGQDEIKIGEDLRLILGARLEHNDDTGSDVLPNARLAWAVVPDHLLWTSLARAVRSPSRLDRDVHIPGAPPYLLGGGPSFRGEVAKVFELGYRGKPSEDSTLSVTAFQAHYERLRTLEFDTSGNAVVVFANRMRGRTRGVELWGTHRASKAVVLSAGYSRLDKRLSLEPGSADLEGALASVGSDPKHRVIVRASVNLPHQMTLDTTVRHVSALSAPRIDRYTVADVRVAWQVNGQVELSGLARNLFGRRHAEYEFISPYRSEFGRSVQLQLSSRF